MRGYRAPSDVTNQDGLRLDEHLSELLERPPMAQVLEEVPAYQANMEHFARIWFSVNVTLCPKDSLECHIHWSGRPIGQEVQDLLAILG